MASVARRRQSETINAAAKRRDRGDDYSDVKQDRRRLTYSPELIILGLVIFTYSVPVIATSFGEFHAG